MCTVVYAALVTLPVARAAWTSPPTRGLYSVICGTARLGRQVCPLEVWSGRLATRPNRNSQHSATTDDWIQQRTKTFQRGNVCVPANGYWLFGVGINSCGRLMSATRASRSHRHVKISRRTVWKTRTLV